MFKTIALLGATVHAETLKTPAPTLLDPHTAAAAGDNSVTTSTTSTTTTADSTKK